MPSFKYEVRDSSGQVSVGVVQAATLLEASAQLRGRGQSLLNLTPVADRPTGVMARLRSVSVEFGPGLKDVMNFTSQLAVMIKAGINIRTAIASVADQMENAKFRAIIQRLKADVEAGTPFSDALARHPKVFSPLYVNMVRASEMSGNFAKMLERIAAYLQQQCETRSMVRGAMVYPAIIGVMAVVTTIFLLTFVLPRFTALFAGKEALLPGPTKALIAASDFLRNQWYIVVGAAVAAGVGFRAWVKTRGGRITWDRTKLRIPIFRKMLRALYITRGMHTMGELISAGVPMLETLKITGEVSGNILYKALWMQVHNSVKQGDKIATPLAKQRMLPKNVVQMISAGEESGKLGDVLRDVAEYYSGELRNTIKAVTAMIEPLMIVIMGVVVGFIAMSIILPIFKMSSLVK